MVLRPQRKAAESGVTSLLDHTEAEWRELLARQRTPGDGGLRVRSGTFLLFALEVVETLR